MAGAGLSRRTVAVAGLGLPALAACSGDPDPAGRPPAGEAPTTPSPSPEAPSPEAPTSASPTKAPAPGLVDLADVPVGGGRVVAAEEVVVTQPERGRIMCFSAVCTHRGCVVSDVRGGTINCGCHGSRFSVADGTVVNGPASTALPTVPITVQDGVVRLA
jgi:Rieske Fe-S protein